jgi:selenocysteine-specific elongation factor
MILDAGDQKLKRLKDEITLRLLEKEQGLTSEDSWVEVALKDAGMKTLNLHDLSIASKRPAPACEEAVKKIEAKLVRFEPNRFMHRAAFESTMDHVVVLVENFHIKNPLRAGMDLLVLRNTAKLELPLFEKTLAALAERGTLVVENAKVRRSTFAIKLSKEDTEAAVEVERLIRDTRFNTPRQDEIYPRFKYTKDRIDKVLGLLIDNGSVAALKDGVLLHRDSVKEAAKIIAQAIQEKGPIEAAQFRDLIGTTRKYVIPLLEHLDDIGVTQRVENRRVLRKSAQRSP